MSIDYIRKQYPNKFNELSNHWIRASRANPNIDWDLFYLSLFGA